MTEDASILTKPYTVALREAIHLPTAERFNAEIRYATALERELGGAHGVAETLKAWKAAEENEASMLSNEEAATAARWPRAVQRAELEGRRTLGDVGEAAHFAVLLPSGHAVAG